MIYSKTGFLFEILKITKSKLFFNVGVYGLGSLLNSAIPFFILPILTRYLTPVDYGIISMFNILLSFCLPFVGVSTNSAISRNYYNGGQINLKVYLSNCFLILIFSTIIVSLVVWLFSYPISLLSDFPENSLLIVIISSFCSYIITIVLTLWQMQSKSLQYTVFQFLSSLLGACLSLWMVISLGFKWEGRILGQLVSYVIFAILGIFILYKNGWFDFKFNTTYIKDALNYGIPLIPHTIGAIIMTMSDRFFITNMIGLSDTGIYSVGYAFGSIIGFVENSFNIAFIPWLFERLNANDEDFKIRIVKMTYLYFVIIILLALISSYFFQYFLVYFVGDKFLGAKDFIFWISMSFAFSGMYKMVVNYIFYVGKTKILAWLTFSSAVLNIILNYILIYYYGAIGAAMSTLAVNIIFFFLTWILSNRIYKMPWFLKKSKI